MSDISNLLQDIYDILKSWFTSFGSFVIDLMTKLNLIETETANLPAIKSNTDDIKDNTGAIVTPVLNMKTNTDSIKTDTTTIKNTVGTMSNQITTISTNVGTASAYAEDVANNTLDIKDKVVTIASDTTQIRSNTNTVVTDLDKLLEAVKWSCLDIETTETVEDFDSVSFDTDLVDSLVRLNVGINSIQLGSGTPSYNNVRSIIGYSDLNIIFNGNTYTISLGSTVYSGMLDVNIGELIIDKTMKVFDGSNDEIWNDYPTANGFFVSGINDHATENYGDGKCNILPTSKSVSTLGVIYGINSKYIFTSQVKSEWNISTVADLRTFLSTNNLEIEYKLATPITISLTPSQLSTISGINTLSIDTNGNVSVTYKESVKHYLDKNL